MKRWAWMVAALYVAALLALTAPAVLVAFVPHVKIGDAWDAFKWWPYWVWLGVMLVSQWALLAVPVRVASLRPVSQGPVWRTILAGGLAAGGLVVGTFFSIYEFIIQDKSLDNGPFLTAVEVGLLAWCVWALIFSRMSRRMEPTDWVSRQCRWLVRGSILELLVAVPTHVVARYRDYCCAGFMTFIGLTMGVSVMLFAYGPAVFLLFAGRWKRLHPDPRRAIGAM